MEKDVVRQGKDLPNMPQLERVPDKHEVTSSSLVSPTRFLKYK